MDIKEVRKRLLSGTIKAGGLRPYSRQNKVSAPYVSDVIKGKRDPGPKILQLLGLRKVKPKTIYEER